MDPPVEGLDLLSDEVILEFLYRLDSLEDLASWCLVSQKANRLCNDNVFWHNKYRMDFGEFPQQIMIGPIVWKDRYRLTYLAKRYNSPISAGHNHYGIIDNHDNLYMAGKNYQGQLSVGDREGSKVPIKVMSISIVSISCSKKGQTTGAVSKDATAFVWGSGYGFWAPRFNTIHPISLPKKVIKIVVSQSMAGIIAEDYSIYMLGNNPERIPSEEKVPFPADGRVRLLPIRGIDIHLEFSWMAVIDTKFQLYLSGRFAGIKSKRLVPVDTPEPVQMITGGERNMILLSTTGNVYARGTNYLGQLGIGQVDNILIDHKEFNKLKLSQISSIASSPFGKLSAAISKDGKLYMWGNNQHGLIFDDQNSEEIEKIKDVISNRGGVSMVISPIQIDIGSPVSEIDLGESYAIAVTTDGIVNLWGDLP